MEIQDDDPQFPTTLVIEGFCDRLRIVTKSGPEYSPQKSMSGYFKKGSKEARKIAQALHEADPSVFAPPLAPTPTKPAPWEKGTRLRCTFWHSRGDEFIVASVARGRWGLVNVKPSPGNVDSALGNRWGEPMDSIEELQRSHQSCFELVGEEIA